MVNLLETPVVYANDFINLTEKTFYVYDNTTGCIWEFPPITLAKNEIIRNMGDYIVVNDSDIKDYSEADMDHICHIAESSAGRHNVVMSRIELANAPGTEVCIRNYGNHNGKLTDD